MLLLIISLTSSILSNKDSADPDTSMMRGQLVRHVVPPPNQRKPAKFQPKDYFLRDQRDYEKSPGIKDPKKFVHPKPMILDIKPYKCMDYTLSDIDNAWMTIYGENLGRNDLRDVGGISIVAGEHEFPCSNIVIGPPPPRRPGPNRHLPRPPMTPLSTNWILHWLIRFKMI